MTRWPDLIAAVEALEDLALDPALVRDMERSAAGADAGGVHFYTPSFKQYASSELASCGGSRWPAISVTGAECALQCDHCKAKLLEPMIPATTPAALREALDRQIGKGAEGCLLTGGSNLRNEVDYTPFWPVVQAVKRAHPAFRFAVHSALVSRDAAQRMADAGVDVAMMDVIGAQDTVRQVYHLRRRVADFEATLAHLVATPMKVVPHIVIGLHYGHLLGEWNALDIVRRHKPSALVLVVIMPFYAPARRPFAVPRSAEVGRFFLAARKALPDIPLLLGCARPAGRAKQEIDTYAVLAGLNGLAHPAEGAVELAARLGREVRVSAACCSIGIGEQVVGAAAGAPALRADIEAIIRQRRGAKAAGRLAGIPVVAA